MKIYFDMDGVLADFDASISTSQDLNHPTENLTAANRALKEKLWHDIEQNVKFWSDMPIIKNAEQMLNTATRHAECFVLSKAPSAKHFINGEKYVRFIENEKRKWILKHFGNFFDISHIIICNGNKGELIHPTHNDILIDDRQENIKDWELCGGRGILFQDAATTSYAIENLSQN